MWPKDFSTTLFQPGQDHLVSLIYRDDQCAILVNHQVLAYFQGSRHNGTLNRLGAWTEQGAIKVVLDDLRFWNLGGGSVSATPPPTQTPVPSPGTEGKQAWNVKALIKLLVMSATYRQASTVTAEKCSPSIPR